MTLTASSASYKGAGRKRKAKSSNISRLSLEDRTKQEHKRLVEISVLSSLGLSKTAIAKRLDLHPATITNYLKKQATYFPNLKDVDAYRINKESLIQAVESQALQSIADSLKNTAPNVRDASLAFRTLHQASRLESNQSTANIANTVQFSSTPLLKTKDS